ncbi:MAG: nucleoside-diphosphate kinase [Bacteroidota bacterium]
MKNTHTLAIIKPYTLKDNHAGPIITQIQQAGFTIHNLYITHLSLTQAQAFYKIHQDKFFYYDLCTYMSSGPVMVMMLEKENAVQDFRDLIGATDPSQAKPDTIRAKFGRSIDHNAIHGSDAEDTARQEIAFFFAGKDLSLAI